MAFQLQFEDKDIIVKGIKSDAEGCLAQILKAIEEDEQNILNNDNIFHILTSTLSHLAQVLE